MVVPGRHKSVAFFIALGAGLFSVILLLYIGWVLLNWRTGILLLFGVLLVATVISGVVLNTIFLVRETQRNEQHDAFINAVTHELKTPVASIRLYLETLMTRTVDEKKRKDFYQTMLEDSERLLSTIEQVLRTGRLGPANRLVNLSPIDLRELVDECVDRARRLHNLPPDALKHSPGPAAKVSGEIDEVRAAVFNLIDNAVKYSGKSVHVTVETAKTDREHVAVRVRDQGVGIPNTELKRIFKRFYRIPGPISMRPTGTGLGLFIVRSVAKRHGGRAWAESEGLGRGSTFVLQFPISK
jgi:two-component system sensor histidine kinase SenX3